MYMYAIPNSLKESLHPLMAKKPFHYIIMNKLFKSIILMLSAGVETNIIKFWVYMYPYNLPYNQLFMGGNLVG